MIKSWTPEQVKKEIMDTLEANGELAGSFVEADARRRLIAIKEPEWGAGYRRKIVAALLMHQVERKANEVVINVGVGRTSSSHHHGFYIELGSKTKPAQPYLRPAVFENAQKIVGLLIAE